MMTWKQLRTLAQPSSAASPKDHLELELPLKVIAPLFLAAQKNLAMPKIKASVSAEIPDLFFGFPQPACLTRAASFRWPAEVNITRVVGSSFGSALIIRPNASPSTSDRKSTRLNSSHLGISY